MSAGEPRRDDGPAVSRSHVGLRCRCGSDTLRVSGRSDWRSMLLRVLGAQVYTCEACGRRFAFAALGKRRRERRAGAGGLSGVHEGRATLSRRRRRVLTAAFFLFAAVAVIVVVAWTIHRAERAELEAGVTLGQ